MRAWSSDAGYHAEYTLAEACESHHISGAPAKDQRQHVLSANGARLTHRTMHGTPRQELARAIRWVSDSNAGTRLEVKPSHKDAETQCMMQGTPWQRLARAVRWVARLPEIKSIMRFMQILSSMLFVVLYVWGTYSTPRPFSWRFNLDIALCALFATEWLWRLVVSQYTRNSTCPFPYIKACLCCFHCPYPGNRGQNKHAHACFMASLRQRPCSTTLSD